MTEEHSPALGEPEPRTVGTAIDTTVPHSARIWNYWLGGKHNYEIDRVAGDQFSAATTTGKAPAVSGRCWVCSTRKARVRTCQVTGE